MATYGQEVVHEEFFLVGLLVFARNPETSNSKRLYRETR